MAVDAREALASQAQYTLLAQDLRCRVIGLLRETTRLSPLEHDLMMAVFRPQEISERAYRGLARSLDRACLKPDPGKTAAFTIRGWIEAYGMTIESDGMAPILNRVMTMAATRGYREIPWAMLLDGVSQAQSHWMQMEQSVRGELERGDISSGGVTGASGAQ